MPGGGSDQRQSGRPSRAITDGAGGHKGVRAQRPLGWRGNFRPGRCKQRRPDMIVVARVVMIRASDVVFMAVLGVIGTVIGLGGHGSGTMLNGFNGRSDCQGQSKAQDRPKRP